MVPRSVPCEAPVRGPPPQMFVYYLTTARGQAIVISAADPPAHARRATAEYQPNRWAEFRESGNGGPSTWGVFSPRCG